MTFLRVFAALSCLSIPISAAGPGLELVSLKKIWGQAPHSAFGDLIRFRDQWFCVFREGKWHVARSGEEDDGKLRVLSSADGETWASAALIAESHVDLRDPHLSITADGRLMIVAGGSEYPGGKYAGRRPRVLFSKDGRRWSAPEAVLERGHWLWRVTWHSGRAYGVSKYGSPSKELPEDPRRANLVTSSDGRHWETITEFKVPGADETTVRFLPDGRMMALMRRVWSDGNTAWVGTSTPPYTKWDWKPSGHFVGGPNFIVLPDRKAVAGGRIFPNGDGQKAQTALGLLTENGFTPSLTLPSNGDSSYPGFVWHNGLIWTLYYSSHEGNTSIYLAKVRVNGGR